MSGSRFPADELRDRLAVYLVADPEGTRRNLLDDVQAALAGGVTCVQLRAKRLDGYDAWRLASTLRALCAESDALFIVNDRLDVALAVEADGVHLGTTDLPVDVARGMTPAGFVIGFSPQTMDDVHAADPLGADYAGLGPVFATGSKADAGPPIGLDGLRARAAACHVPTVAIGGISLANARQTISAGVDGVAVISAIIGADQPERAASDLTALVRAELSSRDV